MFAAHQAIRPAFEAAKAHVAGQNYSRSESFSQNGHKKSPVAVATGDICASQILLRSVGTSSQERAAFGLCGEQRLAADAAHSVLWQRFVHARTRDRTTASSLHCLKAQSKARLALLI